MPVDRLLHLALYSDLNSYQIRAEYLILPSKNSAVILAHSVPSMGMAEEKLVTVQAGFFFQALVLVPAYLLVLGDTAILVSRLILKQLFTI